MGAKKDKDYLDKLRHSTAHLLAAAVLDLYPKAKPTLGPSIEDGFYYDFDFAGHKSAPGIDDLHKIEERMREIVKKWDGFKRSEVSAEEALKEFSNNEYKKELIKEFSKEGQQITIYQSGSFRDLCRGGHIENPKKELVHFKLLSIAGAYWRGDEKNKMLTRIYGTIFPTKKELDKYLWQMEEAEKRDNRKLGKELEIFTISSHVGPGLILWLPKGTVIREEIEKLGKETEAKYGYQRVTTPHIGKEELYITSGHLPYYASDMWPPMEYEGERYYVKPMNCPHMHMIYKFKPRSYKELPIRFAEFGTVYRHEDSGTLLGLLRVRGHTTNDAHIYLTEDLVIDEIIKVMEIHSYYYKLFGIKDYFIELALPDFEKKKDKYFDDPIAWEKAIDILRKAAKQTKADVVEKEGSAAFYGPKFDFNIKSAIGREFGASTNQLDFGSGKRFNLTYIDKDGAEKIIPYIIHRAPLGSEERFIGFLIEHFAGAFPVWLSPVQVKVLPITERNIAYASEIVKNLRDEEMRAELDDRNETLQAKIRDAQNEKVPYMLIVGDKEEKAKKVAVRLRTQKDLGQMGIEKFIERLRDRIKTRSQEI